MIGIALNIAFVAVEFGYGVLSNSVALMADAGHNLGDVVGLAAAWIASILAARAPSPRFTYGLRSSSILAAMFNAILLLVAVGAISWEAIQRFTHPEPVASLTVMMVAGIGIAVNGVTALLFAAGRRRDVNVRGAFLHMAADALVSVGVVIAALVILLTDWLWLDPVVSLMINAVIVWTTWSLLTDSLKMSMDAVPDDIDPRAVRALLEGEPGVASVHDLHVWPIGSSDRAMTAHLVMPEGSSGDDFLHRLCERLEQRFEIGHVTLQIERGPAEACALAPDTVI